MVAGTLADAGSNSSIGTGNASPSAADLVLNGGVLGYGGGAAASTNRQFTLTNAGGGLDVSGGGAVTFANTATVATTGSGARTLTLSGGGTGLGTLAAQIPDGTGGSTSVTKTGTSTWRLNNDTNNFTGAVSITGGTLEVTSIGNNGAASAVGAGSNVVLNNAGIRYIGAGAQASNRTLTAGTGIPSTSPPSNSDSNIANNANSTIDASGTSPTATLSLSGGLAGTTAGGNHKLTLTGSNTGNNTFSANLTDGGPNSGSALFLDKNGAGTWVLSGTNNYTGRTNVTAGKLVLQNTRSLGDPSMIGYAVATGAAFNNQLFMSGTGSVEMPVGDMELERLAMDATTTSLKLGGLKPDTTRSKLNVYTGASGNGGGQNWQGIISGVGDIYVSPPNPIANPAIGLPGNIPVTFPSGGTLRTIVIQNFNTFTGDFHVQGANVNFNPPNPNNLAATVSLGGGDLEVSNLRSTQPGINVDFAMNTTNSSQTTPPITGTVNFAIGNLSGSIVPPTSGTNTVSFALTGGGQRRLVIKQTADTTFAGAFNGNGGQIWLDPASTGTLTLTGNNTNNGRIFIQGGTLKLKSQLTLSATQLSGGGGGIELASGGTLAFNVGGAAVAQTGVPTIGAEWDSTQIDALRALAGVGSPAKFIAPAGSKLGFDTTNAPGGVFTYNNATAMTGAYGIAKLGAGTLTLPNANVLTGATDVRAGTLLAGNADALPTGAVTVAAAATARLQAGLPKAATVASIATAATGKFDLTNNSMVVKGMADSAVRTLLQSGYNGGAWNGATGIVSSSVTAETSVGYATQAQTGITDFKGVTGLAGTDVLVKYTYAGDANLDGKVDIGDLGLLAGAWQQLTGKVWFDGDFTYDGAVDIGDLGLLAGNWQKGTAGDPNPPLMDFNTALAQFSAFEGVAVPEPASLSVLALGGLALGRRRRRS